MPNEIILLLYFLMWYFVVALSCLFIISGLDDLFFDLYYWTRALYRLWKTRHFTPLSYEQLTKKEEQMIAVLIPCWHEAGVIGTMLRHNCYSIDYTNYYLFVGVYPNDPPTANEVKAVAKDIYHVQCVMGKDPGPTNKAANLNGVYEYIRDFENKIKRQFEIFVFHDSEDIIHPLSFKLYNYLMPRKQMIQIPIFPLTVPWWKFTHWVYADEFSEIHTKDIIVREMIHGHVPSAGVGTAFSRQALQILEDPKTNAPFSIDSLTEDYRTSLAIRIKQLKQIFVPQTITRMQWRPRGWFRNGYVLKPVREYIATRAMFPMEYTKSVRQKARWIIGIVFQEWKHTRWPKELILKFTLLHDRKSFITHFINGFGYFVFLFWVLYSLLTYSSPEYPSLQEQFNMHPWVWWLIILATLVMLDRFIQRMIAVKRVYSWLPALMSIPRTFYANILNLHALIRAYRMYNTSPKTQASSKQPQWDKTDHLFPGSHVLTAYRKKIGDLLLEKKRITRTQLHDAILEQQKTGERLGEVLCRSNLLTKQELMRLLSQQYNLKIHTGPVDASVQDAPMAQWLRDNNAVLVKLDTHKKMLTVGIEDPDNELLIERIMSHFRKHYRVKFVLISNA